MAFFDGEALRKWFLSNKRLLLWRECPTPYAVWVSEVMLQQTQVATVINYYRRWMDRYPTIESLAMASPEEVIKSWEGLGYYSRARRLHEGARFVLQHFQGMLPDSPEELAKIKGLGPYTIAAIRSFAFHQKTAPVDGNVLRVFARYYALQDDLAKTASVRAIRLLAEQALPEKEPWVISEAVMELGAMICSPKPQCLSCPLQNSCQGYQQGVASDLPHHSRKVIVENFYRVAAVLRRGDEVLLRKGRKGEVMEDLHEFPWFETPPEGISEEALTSLITLRFGLKANVVRHLRTVSHCYTRHRVRLRAAVLETNSVDGVDDCVWMPWDKVENLSFSAGHRRVLAQLYRT